MQRFQRQTQLRQARLEPKNYPFQTAMLFAMGGSGIMFIVMLMSYVGLRMGAERALVDIPMPKAFIISTLVMLFSSYIINHAKAAFLADRLKRSVQLFMVTIGLGGLFALLQVMGWREFYQSGFPLQTSHVSAALVYVISGLHLLHVAIALAFLIYTFVPAFKKSLDPVSELLMITNPYEKKKVKTLALFWHYVDALWLMLFLVFLFTM